VATSPVVAVRLSDTDRAEIDHRARRYRLSRSEYMRLAALDQLPNTAGVAECFAEVEQRLDRLERFSFGP